jgi:hypothetical protein
VTLILFVCLFDAVFPFSLLVMDGHACMHVGWFGLLGYWEFGDIDVLFLDYGNCLHACCLGWWAGSDTCLSWIGRTDGWMNWIDDTPVLGSTYFVTFGIRISLLNLVRVLLVHWACALLKFET